MYIGADEKAHSGLLASVVGGQWWDRLGPSATFWYGGAFGRLGILPLELLEGWSVMAFGHLEEITDAADERSRALRQLPVQPVAPGARLHWIAMRFEQVTGRYFSGGRIVPGAFFG